MDPWIFSSSLSFVIFVAVLSLQESAEATKLKDVRVRSSTNDDYSDNLNVPYYTRLDLRCHACYLSTHGNDCLTLKNHSKTEAKVCSVGETACKVEWLRTNDALTTFTRGCARDCKDGCRKAGVNYVVERCTSCCSKNFCNYGSGADNFRIKFSWLVASFWFSIYVFRV